jgi:hypothetical protein
MKSVRVFLFAPEYGPISPLTYKGGFPYTATHPKRVLITSPTLVSNAFGKAPEKYRLKALGFRENGRYGV